MNPRDEDKGANGDGADERDDEARVSDGKSQQVSYQEHRADLMLDGRTLRHFYLFNLCVLCVSVVVGCRNDSTETQRAQR